MFDGSVYNDICAAAAGAGIEPAALLAAAEIESGGIARVVVDGRLTAPIQYEFHVFHRSIAPAARARAISLGLASSRWGQLTYARSQRERYALFERAKMIDIEAAHAACAWGIGRVLGEVAPSLGYESAQSLAMDAMSGVPGQMRAMVALICKRELVDALNRHDWSAFVRGYRGPLHDAAQVSVRLADAHSRWRSGCAPRSTSAHVTKMIRSIHGGALSDAPITAGSS